MLGLEGQCADGVAFTLATAYVASLVGYGFAGKFALRAFARLCNVLSPHGFGGSPINVDHISPLRLACAYVLFSPLIPLATIVTWLRPYIIWAGVRFHIAGGRVSAMYRQDASGEWYTKPYATSMEATFKDLAQYQLSTDGVLQ